MRSRHHLDLRGACRALRHDRLTSDSSPTRVGGLSLAVGWMLTPNDGRPDGGLRAYLADAERWRCHDPALFDHLSGVLAGGSEPAVAMIEGSAVLRGARFFSEIVPDALAARQAWGERLVAFAAGADLVFLDPDNGLEIPSLPLGRKGSSKFAAWREVEELWRGGSSVLIYQHYPRTPRSRFVASTQDELRARTGAPTVWAFSTSNVLFLLATQDRHRDAVRRAVEEGLPPWRDQITVLGGTSS